MLFLYNVGMYCYYFAIRIAGFFSPKAAEWYRGRKDIWKQLEVQSIQIKNKHQPIIWMHCASLGEFEQGRPVIEQLKQQSIDYQIVVSFFSPSGYTIRKHYQHADLVTYLPLDTAKNAQRFVDIIQPDLAIFVKYEFWYHYLNTLHHKKIPTILISAIFREKGTLYQLYYKHFFRRMLDCFTHFFVQDEASSRHLNKLAYKNNTPIGDTRVDRVFEIVQEKKEFPLVAAFVEHAPVLVAGSTWAQDEQLLFAIVEKPFFKDWKIIVAPHEIGTANIKRIQKACPVPSLLFSEANKDNIQQHKALIINNIGMLSSLYAYGDIAYIGGGFGAGIHNTLEPIAHALPVIFGTKYQRFEEAVALVQTGGGFSVPSEATLETVLKNLIREENYKQAGKIAHQYIVDNRGATKQVTLFINALFQQKNAN